MNNNYYNCTVLFPVAIENVPLNTFFLQKLSKQKKIFLNGEAFEQTGHFDYLRMHNNIGLQKWFMEKKNIFTDKKLNTGLKIIFQKCHVWSTLLNGCQASCLRKSWMRLKRDLIHRGIMKISRVKNISNKKVLQMVKMEMFILIPRSTSSQNFLKIHCGFDNIYTLWKHPQNF